MDGRAIQANATGTNRTALYASSTSGNAVVAYSYVVYYAAIFGENGSTVGYGVYGQSNGGQAGVYGVSSTQTGVWGESASSGYRLNATIGQPGAATLSASSSFRLCAGFQCAPGFVPSAWVNLPLVRRRTSEG